MDLLWKLKKVRRTRLQLLCETVHPFAYKLKSPLRSERRGRARGLHRQQCDGGRGGGDQDGPAHTSFHSTSSGTIHTCVAQHLALCVTQNREVIDCVIDFQEQKENSSPPQSQDSAVHRYDCIH